MSTITLEPARHPGAAWPGSRTSPARRGRAAPSVRLTRRGRARRGGPRAPCWLLSRSACSSSRRAPAGSPPSEPGTPEAQTPHRDEWSRATPSGASPPTRPPPTGDGDVRAMMHPSSSGSTPSIPAWCSTPASASGSPPTKAPHETVRPVDFDPPPAATTEYRGRHEERVRAGGPALRISGRALSFERPHPGACCGVPNRNRGRSCPNRRPRAETHHSRWSSRSRSDRVETLRARHCGHDRRLLGNPAAPQAGRQGRARGVPRPGPATSTSATSAEPTSSAGYRPRRTSPSTRRWPRSSRGCRRCSRAPRPPAPSGCAGRRRPPTRPCSLAASTATSTRTWSATWVCDSGSSTSRSRPSTRPGRR